jgi:hypothetical protein
MRRRVVYAAADRKEGFTAVELRAVLQHALCIARVRVTFRGKPYEIEVEEADQT